MVKVTHPEIVYLSNGIPVVLQQDEGLVAAMYWWIKTGSGDEAPEEAGFAHFLEHMLFKDAAAKETGRASSGQMARAIESLGGDINAYTSFDQTVYHVTCAAQHWEKVLGIFSSIAKPQKFLKEDFEREREVILEELRKNEDSPGRQLFQSLFSTTFKKHPYGRPVIGYQKVLKAAKVSQLEQFYRRNYVSDRMGLVLVGPFDELAQAKGTKSSRGQKLREKKSEEPSGKSQSARKKAILNILEKNFGKAILPRRTSTPIERTQEPVFNPDALSAPAKGKAAEKNQKGHKANWVVRGFQVKTPTLSFSFRVPELAHPDIAALDVLSGILGMGELSRLYQRLFYQTSLATDVSAGLYVPKDPGMLYFQADVTSLNQVKPVAEEIFKEIKRLIDEGPTEEEIKRVMVNAESERLYATQTVDGAAGRLGFLQYTMGDLNYDREFLDELRSVDSDKIKQVARKYLDFRRMSCILLVPEAEGAFDLKPVEELAKKSLNFLLEDSQEKTAALGVDGETSALSILSKPKKAGASPTTFFQLPSGIRVCFNPRPSSPIFSIHASALGGVRLELGEESQESNWGSSYMMALSWTKGTSSMTANKISSWIEGRAAGLDGFSGRNSIGLQMTALNRDWDTLSGIFSEVLLDPTFPEDEVDHARRIAEDSVRGIEDHSAQLCSKLFLETLFTHHPYGKMIYGSMESLQGIFSERLRSFHRSWVRPDRLVVSISGNIEVSKLDKFLQRIDREAVALARKAKILNENGAALPEPKLKAPRWAEKPLGREQAHILVGGLGTIMTSGDRVPLQLLQTLLGGQSGRLFIELREKKSLAYTVSPVSFEGIEPGYIGTYIACSQDKKTDAIQGIKQVLETLSRKGPTDQEMKRAKEFYLGRRAMDLQGDTALAAHYGMETLYRLEHLSEQEVIKKVSAVTPKVLRGICQKYLVEPHMVTSVVG